MAQRQVDETPGAVWALEAALSATDVEHSGGRIGAYKLVQKIGEGGFGVVWLAEQQEPIKRPVAVKIIKAGMDTEEIIARFEVERQALAMMEHPNIARVFDAGATETGRPFFVMELVRGIAITHYCDENRLSTEARLRLFITICHAVQHAHHKGVIHRDLKPSNILVTLHDGVPVPKIIDFGIAKATTGRLTEKTLFTRFHSFIGTPAYTSPEQMEMSGLDIDTRSDVYTLGVLFYELLTGRPPFDSRALMSSGLEAMRRTILQVDPPKPSRCFSALAAPERSAVADRRNTDAAKLSLLLRGDLDWISMRCLEKDRTRRYDSAASLAADIERHLSDNPVAARPPSPLYLTKKFVSRHKLPVFAAAAVALSLIAGLIVSSALFILERSAHGRALLAEQKEGELRRQAELAGENEVKRAARTALDLANRSLAEGRVADGLAYLAYTSKKDPKNTVLGPRLASALAAHNFLLPEGPAFACGSRILALHFTSDGRLVYVATEDGTLRAFDAATSELQYESRLGGPVLPGGWQFPRNNDRVCSVRFADNTFGVFDTISGRPRWAPLTLDPAVGPAGETAPGTQAGISPDGRWVFALARNQFWIWDADTGRILLEHTSQSDERIGGRDFTNDGSQVAVAVGTLVKRWSLPDGSPIATTEAIDDAERPVTAGQSALPRAKLRTVSFSPNGRLIAVSGVNSGIAVFDATTGSRLHTLPPPRGHFDYTTAGFVSDTRIFAASERVSGSWDLTKREFTPLPIAAASDLRSRSFDRTGTRILTTAADGLVRLCDLGSGKNVVEPTRGHPSARAALAPDGGRVFVGSATGSVQRFRTGRGSARPLTLPRLAPTLPVAFLPDPPTRLLWMKSTQACVLDAKSGREVSGGFAYPTPVLSLGAPVFDSPVRPDFKFLVVPTGGGMQAWEIGPAGIVNVATLAGTRPRSGGEITFSPHGDLVAAALGEARKLGVWHLRTGAPAGPVITSSNYLRPTTHHFSPDGTRLTLGALDGSTMIVDVATAKPVVPFATPAFVPVLSLIQSPDGTRVVTTNARNETRIWNAATGQPLGASRATTDTRDWGRARFAPNGRWFATWGGHSAHLWDGWTGAPVGESIPAGGSTLRFSRDSRSLATAGDQGGARVWDVPSGQPFTEPMGHDAREIGYPEFSPDGRFLRVEHANVFDIWSVPPRLPEGASVPDWLLRLATVCASRQVNDAGELIDIVSGPALFREIQAEVAALSAGAPLSEWGRWIIDDNSARSIAPGFILTPEEADKIATAGLPKR